VSRKKIDAAKTNRRHAIRQKVGTNFPGRQPLSTCRKTRRCTMWLTGKYSLLQTRPAESRAGDNVMIDREEWRAGDDQV
jgi:hypothetical protein